jgi:hypothetical protein
VGAVHQQRRSRFHPQALALAVCLAAAVSGCSSDSKANLPTPTHGAPDLAGFLRTPVATPTACPANVNGSTVGRHSPWVGTVDVSVFLKSTAGAAQVTDLGRQLRALDNVVAVYFESQAQAYAEFQRLYTCSARIQPSQVPASYRLVLTPGLSLITRDDLVRKITHLPAVDTVSCDPATPCVDATGSG